MPNTADLMKTWADRATRLLRGKVVKEVRYMDNNEEWGWGQSAPIIIFEDGTQLLPMKDPEGNGPGAFSVNSVVDDTEETIGPI